jgi:hypothetical protein
MASNKKKPAPMQSFGVGFEPVCDAPSYKVTASGTFSKDNWQVKGTGIHHTPAGEGRISDLDYADLEVRVKYATFERGML